MMIAIQGLIEEDSCECAINLICQSILAHALIEFAYPPGVAQSLCDIVIG